MNKNIPLPLAGLLVFTLANHLLWSALIPFAGFPHGAPDEIHHFEVTRFIYKTGQVPIFGPDKDLYIRVRPGAEDNVFNRIYGWYAMFPSGTYILSGLFMRILPLTLYPPQQIFVARLFSVVCNLCLVYFAYRIANHIFPRDRFLGWGLPVLVSMIPQVVFVGSYHNPDVLTMAATTASMLLGLRLLGGKGVNWTDAILLGLALSLVAVAKLNGWLVSFLFTGIILLLHTSSNRMSRALMVRLILVAVPPILTLISWFTFQQQHYGDILARDVFSASWSADRPFLIPFAQQGYSPLSFLMRTNWLEMTFKSFWGIFGYMSVQLHPVFYWGLLLMCLASLGGLIKGGVSRIKRGGLDIRSRQTQVLGIFAFVTMVLIAVAAYQSLYNDYQPQGRYLFPALVPICLFLLLGWREFLPSPRWKSIGLGFLCVGMSLFNLLCLGIYIMPGVMPVQEQWFF